MSVSIKVSPTSISGFRQGLIGAELSIREACIRGMNEASDRVLNLAQSRVPRDTGALSQSAHRTNNDSSNLIRRTISYGDNSLNPKTGRPTAFYAPLVHERPNKKHPNSYKWLERSILEYGREAFLTELTSAIRSSL